MENREMVQVEEKASALQAGVAPVVAEIHGLDVVNGQTNEKMTELVGEVAKWEKQGKDDELSFTRPLNAVIKSIRDRYKPQLEMLAQAKTEGKGKQKKYFLAEQEKARQAELKRQEEERKAREEEDRRLREAEELLNQGKDEEAEKLIDEYKEPEVTAPAPEPERFTKTASGHSSIIKRRKDFRIMDEKKVPRKYLEINTMAIRQDISAGVEFSPERDGIEVYEEIDVATRTRRG